MFFKAAFFLSFQSIPPGEGALSETVEKLREMSAMKETLVCLKTTSGVAESAVAAAAYTVIEPDVGVSTFVKAEKDETCVTDAQVFDTSPLPTPPEGSIFSENTANRDSGGLDQAEDFVELALDFLLDTHTEGKQVIKSVGTKEHEEETCEENQKRSASQGAGLRVPSSDRAQSERSTDTKADATGYEEEEEAEVDGKVRKK